MNKDIEWLKEEIKVFQKGENMFTAEFNAGVQQALEYVQELLDQLEEPEITEEQAWRIIADKYGSEQQFELNKRFLEINGYTVKKKEPLYTVCFEDKKNVHRTGMFLYKDDGEVYSGNAMDVYYKEDSESHLTEKEIKDYDERFWQFAVPVEEVTE